MTDEELREIGKGTMHGNLPMQTVREIYFKALALMEERDRACAALKQADQVLRKHQAEVLKTTEAFQQRLLEAQGLTDSEGRFVGVKGSR